MKFEQPICLENCNLESSFDYVRLCWKLILEHDDLSKLNINAESIRITIVHFGKLHIDAGSFFISIIVQNWAYSDFGYTVFDINLEHDEKVKANYDYDKENISSFLSNQNFVDVINNFLFKFIEKFCFIKKLGL